MPYITPERRQAIDSASINAGSLQLNGSGELNYYLTSKLTQLIGPDVNYETLNSIIGALECCKLEFYRRAVALYEDKKKEANGDVYTS